MRIALAYSGGLDTSVIIPWLKEHFDATVIAVSVNVGQREDFDKLRVKALDSGAEDVWIPDCREEFIQDFAFPMVQAEALYEGQYLLGTAIARPLIAKKLVQAAHTFGAEAVAHGATGKGNDQVRLEVGVMALNPDLTIIAPWRIWELKGRQDEMSYAQSHGITVDATPASPYSRDENLWHVSHEGGVIEDANKPVPSDVYTWTTAPKDAPDLPESLDVTFVCGIPTAIDGYSLNGVELVTALNQIGSRHGVGRLTMIEDRLVGIKSRGVYETPGGTLLYAAHQALASVIWDRDLALFIRDTAARLAKLVYDGLWFSPLVDILLGAVTRANQTISGTVRLKCFKGQVTAEYVKNVAYPLYSQELATFEKSRFNHQDAAGFIRLWGLPSQMNGMVSRLPVHSKT